MVEAVPVLVDGKIPARTECPYKAECMTFEYNMCQHRGKAHKEPFSCVTAAGFERINIYREQERS